MKIVICSKNGYVSVAYVTGILCFFCCVVVESSWG